MSQFINFESQMGQTKNIAETNTINHERLLLYGEQFFYHIIISCSGINDNKMRGRLCALNFLYIHLLIVTKYNINININGNINSIGVF